MLSALAHPHTLVVESVSSFGRPFVSSTLTWRLSCRAGLERVVMLFLKLGTCMLSLVESVLSC